MAKGQSLLPVAVGQQPVVADLDEAVGKDVQQKPAQEFLPGQRHLQDAVLFCFEKAQDAVNRRGWQALRGEASLGAPKSAEPRGTNLVEIGDLAQTHRRSLSRTMIRSLARIRTLKSRAVETTLKQGGAAVKASEGGSRWARLVAEIAEGSMSLGEDAARFEQDRKDFREQFRFKHDE
jgi:hypothetical protein